MSRLKGSHYALNAPRAVRPADYILIQQALVTITSSERVNRKWSLYFRVLWETGIRPGEALALKASEVQSESLLVHRLKKKGHPEDEVKIQPTLGLALQSYIALGKIKPGQRLFPDSIGAVHFIFNRVKQKLNLPKSITPHSFRHGFAMNVVAQAPPALKADAVKMLKTLQRALAHKSVNTVGVYLEVGKEDVDSLIAGMKF